ncbi:MAG: hypothetical protein KKH92_09465 [Firmicutes bacterium]|nr:hypothetical protein [Bacillota bacterium]
MKSTDLYQIKVNHFGSHIVVDLMIVIIITTISILLLNFLISQRKRSDKQDNVHLDCDIGCKITVLSILVITHIVFGLWPLIQYSLEESLSTIELFFLPFTYGIYLTFFMKKINGILSQKLLLMETIYLKKTFRLSLHFSIIPLLIASILVLIN